MEINKTTDKDANITLTLEEIGYMYLALNARFKVVREDVSETNSIEFLKLSDSMNQLQRLIDSKS